MLSKDSRFNLLIKIGLVYFIIQIIIRFVFVAFSFKEVSFNVLEFLGMFILGLGYDICVLLYLLVPLAIYVLVFSAKLLNNKYGKKMLKFMLAFFSLILAFTSISEYYFWDEFHTRFNFIAVDYLVYTQELFGNIFQSYNIPLLLSILGICAFGIYTLIINICDIYK